MNQIKSIGNLGDMIAPKRWDGCAVAKPKRKLSEMLREEKELLFGNKKKAKRNITHTLPRAVRRGSNTVQPYNEAEIVLALETIIDYLRKTKVIDLQSIQELDMIENRYWLLFVCYIAYQCFDLNAQHIAAYFNMTRDITTQTHRHFKKETQNGVHDEEQFLKVFDYFMRLNKMDYL